MFPDLRNVPNVPNNVPNISGHVGQDGLSAEGYVAKISMLILATYPVAALDVTRFEAKIKTDIPKSQHVDFRDFDLILTNLGWILANVGQMCRTIWGHTCSERSEHKHCSGTTQSVCNTLT